ncbi:MAG: helix-turn-helix domain-containing protein [Aureispira sp.]
MKKIQPLALIPNHQVTTFVEQKRGISLEFCELNIFETRKKVTQFPLAFNGFTITSMLRGTKRVHFADSIERKYVPGNTIIAPSYTNLVIDFPEASLDQPTQCTALTLNDTFVKKQILHFNELLDTSSFISSWRILDYPILLYNNENLVKIHEKITLLSASSDPFKAIHIQLLLKELILCVLKIQNLNILKEKATIKQNDSPFSAIIAYIRQNIFQNIQIEDLLRLSTMSKSSFYRAFTEELGISPYRLIIDERLKMAKNLLLQEDLSVKETAYAVGFSSPNYFIRLFKKHEGLTPNQFVKQQRASNFDGIV